MPIEGVVLQMKSMHIDAVINFPFPTPPERSTLRKAETTLTHLGALGTSQAIIKGSAGLESVGGQITELGKTMSLFPLSPRFSRMLVSGQQQGCLPYVISIVSALSVGDPFLHDEGLQQEDDDAETDVAVVHLTSEAMKLKEAQRLRRKAFFESQNVSLSSCYIQEAHSLVLLQDARIAWPVHQ
jgi:ATP-dependent RNA helicase DHX37/DHR1